MTSEEDYMPDNFDPERHIIIRDPTWMIAYLDRRQDAMKAEIEELRAEVEKVRHIKLTLDLASIVAYAGAFAGFYFWVFGW